MGLRCVLCRGDYMQSIIFTQIVLLLKHLHVYGLGYVREKGDFIFSVILFVCEQEASSY